MIYFFKYSNTINDTVKNIFTAYFNYLEHQRAYSKNTLIAYNQDLDNFCTFIASYKETILTEDILTQLDRVDFRSFLSNRREGYKNSQTSLARNVSSLRSFYGYIEQNYGIKNEAIFLMPSPKGKQTIIRSVEYNDILCLLKEVELNAKTDWIAMRDVAFFITLYATGMRISEILSITLSDYNSISDLSLIHI